MHRIFLIFLMIFSFSPCLGAKSTTLSQFYELMLKRKTDASTEIRKALARIHKSQLSDPVLGEVVKFYEQRNFAPYWMTDGQWSLRASYALDVLKNAGSEGLNANNYAQAVSLFPTKRPRGKKKEDRQTPQFKKVTDKALQEIYFCAGVFRYMIDVTGGRVSDSLLTPLTDQQPKPVSPADITLRSHGQDETGAWLQYFGPKNDHYRLLKAELGELRKQWESGKSWMPLKTKKELMIGAKGSDVRDLTEILIAQGFLKEPKPYAEYDEFVEAAVRKLQEEHNLPITGKLSPGTRKALNQTIEERIRQVQVNMERARWLPDKFPETYVWVNIPSFKLKLFKGGRYMETFKTCVGKTNTPTPQMFTTLYGIRFNPSWTVPRRIAWTLVPRIREDPDYIKEQNFILLNLKDKSPVDMGDLDVSDLDLDKFPYILRQLPGEKNALGQIRFSLRNRRNIHLHDTTYKKLFDKHTRTFSAGCVRVQNPERLAYLLLNKPDRWAPSVIDAFLKTDELKDIDFEEEIPTYIVYHTVWFTQKGEPRYALDMYKNDRKLDYALHAYESQKYELDLNALGVHKDAAKSVKKEPKEKAV